jgi:serine/threonine protein kinase
MRELVKHHEAWALTIDSEKFDHTVTVWKEGDNYFQAKHSARAGSSFDLGSLPATTPIPMQLFMGRWHESFTESPILAPTDSFLKRPPIVLPQNHDDVTTDSAGGQGKRDFRTPGDDMVDEAKIYEILKDHPHRNICVYYGCVRNGDYLSAICLKKYGRSLQEAVWKGDPTLDHAAILAGISKGLRFLHETLGLVHNDINPSNIMLDDMGEAVIIDFDSCMPIGQNIGYRKGGTPGWTSASQWRIAVPENDLYGLSLVSKFIEGSYR